MAIYISLDPASIVDEMYTLKPTGIFLFFLSHIFQEQSDLFYFSRIELK